VARHSDWEGEAVSSLIVATVLLAGFIIVILGRIALATAKEIGRVYIENTRSTSARPLWYALAGLLGVWLLCGVVAAIVPTAGAACVYTAAWTFFIFVVTIEVIDWQARPGLPRPGDVDSLDTYLGALGASSVSDGHGHDAVHGEAA
jgi:uncharacterized iron-regulated membrane protein